MSRMIVDKVSVSKPLLVHVCLELEHCIEYYPLIASQQHCVTADKDVCV